MAQTYLLISQNEAWLQQQTLGMVSRNSLQEETDMFGMAIAQIPNWEQWLNNPDVTVIDEKKAIGIEIVRDINTTLLRRPYQSQTSLVIVKQADTLTLQAQNALLKLLEEPPSYATIFLWAGKKEAIIQTIQSRCLIVEDTANTGLAITEEKQTFLAVFLKASTGERFQMLQSLGNDRLEVADFIEQLIIHYTNQLKQTHTLKLAATIHQLIAYQNLLSRQVSPKFIAEMVALT